LSILQGFYVARIGTKHEILVQKSRENLLGKTFQLLSVS
jgi:hypothetical protein